MVRRIFQIVVVGFVLAPVSVPAQTVPLSVTVRAGRASAFGGSETGAGTIQLGFCELVG